MEWGRREEGPNQGAPGDAPAGEPAPGDAAPSDAAPGDAPPGADASAGPAAPPEPPRRWGTRADESATAGGPAAADAGRPAAPPASADDDPFAERPELFVGAAFVGGFALAQIVKRFGP